LGDLIVKSSYTFAENDVLTAAKLNLMATPVVELALTDPVNDQNFLRNGNFYSSFWKTPASPGVSCPAGVWTTNPSYWLIRPIGAAINSFRSSVVPDIYSLFSSELQGALTAGDIEFGQQINGDLSATLRRNCTFSGYIYNGSGLVASPKLNFYTADTFNNFATITLRTTVNLQSAANASWTFMTATLDLTSVVNVANGLLIAILLPAGTLNDPTKYVLFSRLKFQIGEVATEFVDDPSLFVQTPSIDSTMLQDGCIARPTLFGPKVIPSTAYQDKSVINSAIADGAVNARTMVPSANTTLTAGFTQPAVAATVSIQVSSTAGFIGGQGQAVSIAGGGWYTLSSVTDATHMVVTNSGATGNAAPAAAVPTGGAVNQASAALNNLGYAPVNKAGDTGIGPLQVNSDDVLGAASFSGAGVVLQCTGANANNAGYLPAIGFNRPGTKGRAIGLATTGRFTVVDDANNQGYLLDSWFKVATGDIQDGSITFAKLEATLVALFLAPGTITMFAGPNPPTGWLKCDGSPVSRTTYSALFAAIGTYWGVGDNSTTFNIPDLRGRAPIGYVNSAVSGITARAIGVKGGAETHQLTMAEMPAHDHGFSQSAHDHGTHSHQVATQLVGAGSGLATGAQWALGTTNTGNSTVPAANANITFSGQGGNAAHDQMQPFAVVYFVVKT
jgi:microcystin-dependent protein